MTSHEISLAVRQFEVLYGNARSQDGLIAIYTKDPYRLELFQPAALHDAATRARHLARRTDVYHLVNLLSPLAAPAVCERRGRGRESEVRSIVALVAEIDVATGRRAQTYYPHQAVAREALQRMPLQPTMLNLSGPVRGGLHVYWVLERPLAVADPQLRAMVKAISRGWQERLRAELSPYRMDSTFDLVRVLRIAGCPNHKYVGVVTRPLCVEDCRYRLEDFLQYVDTQHSHGELDPHGAITTSGGGRVLRCRSYLEHVPDAVSGSHGHDKTFRAACECARFGLSEAEAMLVMAWFNQTKTPPRDKWTEVELEHKLRSAFQTVRQQGQFGLRVRA